LAETVAFFAQDDSFLAWDGGFFAQEDIVICLALQELLFEGFG
jgi:hypothetical protein